MKNFQKIEKKWQKFWAAKKITAPNLDHAPKPFYNLTMFPYPSAEGLHMGNVYDMIGADVYGRFKKLEGYDVFQPMGYDAFGIHSENYALKLNKHPKKVVERNIKNFRRQIDSLGTIFDFSRQIDTTKPEYYKWTQWIFLQLYKNGLAYRACSPVNWCPSCKTVLADEQTEGGVCERCKTEVVQKELEQWFFRITKYAERLLNNLDKIDWSERIKTVQKNWIGKSEGVVVKFNVKCQMSNVKCSPVEVFTTRADTIFGATYLVVAPEHTIIQNSKLKIQNFNEIKNYIQEAKKKINEERIIQGRSKTGIELKGVTAVNPATNQEIPIWVADYVVGGYGTGAIMAVPAHDERDFEFAKKYNLPIKEVIAPYFKDDPMSNKDTEKRDLAVAIVKNPKNNTYLCLDWKTTKWKSFPAGGVDDADLVEAAKREVKEETGYVNLKFIKQIGNSVYAEFYRPHKDSNVFAHFKYLLFELENEARSEISQKEKKQHEAVWVEEDKVASFINVWNQKIIWKKYRQNDYAYCEDGILIDSGEFSGFKSAEAREKMADWLEKNNLGKRKINYKLRDWTISRQRYWGPPIPIIYCRRCWETKNKKQKTKNADSTIIDGKEYAIVPVPEKDLPVTLPPVKDFRPKGTGVSPLAQNKSFVKVKCPDCGGQARRETDVSDNFLDSAWYFLRYPSTEFNDRPFDKKRTKKWLPPDMYRGGPEHAVLHLMYARFINMALYNMGFLPFEEPFPHFRVHGLITKDGVKMSKSRGNVVVPEEYVKKYGADVLRMYLVFLGPYEEGGDFNGKGIVGIERFLGRAEGVLIKFKTKNKKAKNTNQKNTIKKIKVDGNALDGGRKQLDKLLHQAIKKVGEHLETMQFNTAIAALMELLNVMNDNREAVNEKDLETFVLMLAPFAPHTAEELWERLGNRPSVFLQSWPKYEAVKIREEEIDVIIQINGKMRDKMKVKSGTDEKEIEGLALRREKIGKFLGGQPPRRVIVIPGRLINIVV